MFPDEAYDDDYEDYEDDDDDDDCDDDEDFEDDDEDLDLRAWRGFIQGEYQDRPCAGCASIREQSGYAWHEDKECWVKNDEYNDWLRQKIAKLTTEIAVLHSRLRPCQ